MKRLFGPAINPSRRDRRSDCWLQCYAVTPAKLCATRRRKCCKLIPPPISHESRQPEKGENRSFSKARFQGGGISDEPKERPKPGASISSATFKAGIIGTVQAISISLQVTKPKHRPELATFGYVKLPSVPVPKGYSTLSP
jgi:hypothetical protein